MSTITVSADAFRDAAARVLPVVTRDREHPVLACVLINASEGALRLVATDRLRLVVCEVRGATEGGSFSALVDGGALAEMPSPGIDGDITLRVVGRKLEVGSSSGVATVPVAKGEFPKYERYLDADPSSSTLIADRAVLLATIEGVATDDAMAFRFVSGGLEIGGFPPARVAADYAGPELDFHANVAFVHDAVAAATGGKVAIEAAGPVSPIVVRSPDDEGYICVIMPVRVAGQKAQPVRKDGDTG